MVGKARAREKEREWKEREEREQQKIRILFNTELRRGTEARERNRDGLRPNANAGIGGDSAASFEQESS